MVVHVVLVFCSVADLCSLMCSFLYFQLSCLFDSMMCFNFGRVWGGGEGCLLHFILAFISIGGSF